MQLLESGEMYLETILILTIRDKLVRSIDVAKYMSFSKPSVSRAMGRLKEQGYITIDPEGYIMLTESGREIAEKIYERHTVLTALLMRLGISEQTAAEDACKIEHDISDETFEAIKRHVAQSI
ncbi:MAG: metal-dependent transcriptional regulator [Ruminococcaceae bacterium]|jgi:Mn-dependent DtxR family transcriptional regulator|nr:metal-dependent transcriptional regulator [Oscillospiraceae bacterium]